MIVKDIKQTTVIYLEFVRTISDKSCDELADAICDGIYGKLDTKNHNIECYTRKIKESEYELIFTEYGTVKYYPSNNWYEQDDYDEPTTLCEDDFADAVSDIRYEDEHAEYEEECDTIDMIYVSRSEWEEC